MSDSCNTAGHGCHVPQQPDSKTAVNEELADYWNTIYSLLAPEIHEWYEEKAKDTLTLIAKCDLAKDAKIVLVGCGKHVLIDSLWKLGFTNLILVDISEIAIGDLQEKYSDHPSNIQYLVADLSAEESLSTIENVDLWIDRLLFHYFTKKQDLNNYFNTLKHTVAKVGNVILVAHSLQGNDRSGGLPVKRYNSLKLKEQMKDTFDLTDNFIVDFTSPSGKAEHFIYGLFERIN